LHDDSLVVKYNFLILEVASAKAMRSPKHPETLHYAENAYSWWPVK